MPGTIPYPYYEVDFNQNGDLLDATQLDALVQGVATDALTDLYVIAHGWANDKGEARSLYQRLFQSVKSVELAVTSSAERAWGVAGLFWPSKKLAEKDLLPGGAAAADGSAAIEIVAGQLDTLEALAGDAADHPAFAKARSVVSDLSHSKEAQQQFAAVVLRHLPPSIGEEGEPHIPPNESLADLYGQPLVSVFGAPRVSSMASTRSAHSVGGASSIGGDEGGAAGIGNMFSGVEAGAMNLLNYAIYYWMKDRAGVVGRMGVRTTLSKLRFARPNLRLHLIGHSFGARVVTSAISTPEPNGVVVDSLTLLQGAFSHFAFAERYDGRSNGFFRRVLTDHRVSGPVVITYSRHDATVGVAVATASRVASQVASAIGDAASVDGGLGHNGAQRTPEAILTTLLPPGYPYAFQAGRVYNLNADQFISAHSDVTGPEVASAILHAATVT